MDLPRLRSLLDEVLRTGAQIDDVSVEQDFPGPGLAYLLLGARKLPGYADRGDLMLLAIEDITTRVHEAQLRHATPPTTS